MKTLILLVIFLNLFTSCQFKTTRTQAPNINLNNNSNQPGQANSNGNNQKPQDSSVSGANGLQNNLPENLPSSGPLMGASSGSGASQNLNTFSKKSVPQFGLIFSAGGAKAWAHVGVLKELQRFKFPVISVAGVEWGAVVAAAYAQNISANEVEWELSKFKSLEKSSDFIQSAFAKKNVSEMKASFVCPSLNVKSQTVYLLNKGRIDQFLPFCLSSPGLFPVYGQSIAYMSDLQILIQQIKATGVQKIILINVLSSKNLKPFINSVDSLENQIWVSAAAQLAKKNIGIDHVIEIDLAEIGINDFDQRREIINKGSELSYQQIKKIADKYGL